MSPFGHFVTSISLSTALMRTSGISWSDGIAGLPTVIISQSSLDIASAPGLTLISLGIVVGARGPDRLEIPVVNRFTKVRHSLIPHRTLTHWPGFWIVLTVLSCALSLVLVDSLLQAFACVGIGFCIASWLHLIMDIMTPTGIPLLTPFGNRTSLNLYKTASLGEWLCIFIFILLSQSLAALLSNILK